MFAGSNFDPHSAPDSTTSWQLALDIWCTVSATQNNCFRVQKCGENTVNVYTFSPSTSNVHNYNYNDLTIIRISWPSMEEKWPVFYWIQLEK